VPGGGDGVDAGDVRGQFPGPRASGPVVVAGHDSGFDLDDGVGGVERAGGSGRFGSERFELG